MRREVRPLWLQAWDVVLGLLAVGAGALLVNIVLTFHWTPRTVPLDDGEALYYPSSAIWVIAGLGAALVVAGLRLGLDRQYHNWLLVAIGIGLHNFGEGLAIGAAIRLGEVALGTLLIVGFMLHNTTEGLAIVAPLSSERLRLGRLLGLGLIAGAPIIPGAWLGGFLYSSFWSAVFLAIAAGAIAQVVVEITRGVVAGRPLADLVRSAPVVSGLVAGFGVMYLTGMLIG